MVRLGGLAPWGNRRRHLSLSQIVEAVRATPPGHLAGRVKPRPGAVPSAVLVLLYEHAGEPWVVLTRRSAHLRHHASEVCFPGGRSEPCDVDLWATALREATEEVALDPDVVSLVGRLDSFVTISSGSLVYPFVATTARRPRLVPEPAEVEKVLHVRVSELTRPRTWREEIWCFDSDPSTERAMTFFELHGDTVWGATAAVLRRLLMIAVNGTGTSG